jgi:hypothetical protein
VTNKVRKGHLNVHRLTPIIAALALLVAVIAQGAAVSAAPSHDAGDTGFTAAIVAISGQKITGPVINTTSDNFDVGIYIGPGVHDVVVTGATISGFNDEGILVQDAWNIVIKNSTVSGNGVDPVPGLTENKGIVLAGTTGSLVKNNTVENNLADGGISVLDDGPNRPFAKVDYIPEALPVPSTENVIMGNTVRDNAFGCGIVVAAKNEGAGVFNNVVSKNIVDITDPFLGGLPRVGGIVVAGGAFGAVQVMDTVILNNAITGGLIPGISLHAFGPATISDTKLVGNELSGNGAGAEPGLADNTTGIEIFAGFGGTISGTQVLSDSVSDDYYGVWHVGDTGTHISNLTTDATVPVGP